MLTIGIIGIFFSILVYGVEKYIGDKCHRFSFAIIMLLIYMMIAGNYQNADTINYEATYRSDYSQWSFRLYTQWAYFLVINICNNFHLTFVQYRFVVYGIGFLALIYSMRNIAKNKYPIFLLYSFFPMIIDSTQMKSFVAMCFVTLGISFLPRGNKKDKILFIIFVLIGAGYHITSLAFLPLFIVCDNNYNKKVKGLSVIPLILFAIVFSNRSMSGRLSQFMLTNLSGHFNRTNQYLSSKVNYGFLIYFVATFAYILIVILLRREVINNENATETEKSFSNIAFYCALYSLIFMPFYLMKLDFARLLRMLVPTYHILLVVFAQVMNRPYENTSGNLIIRTNTKKILFYVAYLLITAYMFYWEIYAFEDSVLKPFFDYNILLGS